MADEPTPEAPAVETTPEASPAPEEQPQGDDLTGLKTALETERTQRKEFEKELKALRAAEEQRAQAAMSETEKAIAQAKAEGSAEAKRSYGLKAAALELKAEAAMKGVDLSEVGDLLDVSKFLDEDGEPDAKAIKAAVARFTKLAPKPAGPSGGDFGGAPQQQQISLDAQIRKAESEGDWATARSLKTQKMLNR